MANRTNVLSIIENKGFQFNYEKNGNFDKLKFAPLPKKQPKVKTIILPELSLNPQYNTIHKTIADANLALQVKENFENIKYVPISSSGYRGFSALNSRKNGVAESLILKRENITQTSIFTQENENKPQTPLKLGRRYSEPSVKTEEFSTPLKSTPTPLKTAENKTPEKPSAPEIPYSAPSSGELYIPPGARKGGKGKRLFDTLIKDANKAKTRSESTPGSGRKFKNNRQSAALPTGLRSNPFIDTPKSDEE